jgi:hypothetical protein
LARLTSHYRSGLLYPLFATTAPGAVGSPCYGLQTFLTVVLDKPPPSPDLALPDASPPMEEGDPGQPIVLRTESGVTFFRGVIHGSLICLCFWIPLAVAGVLLLT